MARELLGDSGQTMLSLQLLLTDLSANDNLPYAHSMTVVMPPGPVLCIGGH